MDAPYYFCSFLHIIWDRLLKVGGFHGIGTALQADNSRLVRAVSGREVLEECSSVKGCR